MPDSRFTQFDVYWWVACASPELNRYRTRRTSDVECFSPSHYRFRAHSMDGTGEILEIILTERQGVWFVKCPDFDDPSELYPFSFSETDAGAIWTDAAGDELMVIQATV